MQTVDLPVLGTASAWRAAARRLIGARVPPREVAWHFGDAAPQLFDATPLPAPNKPVKTSRDFIALANTVIWHKDPQRFARLYALLWRLRFEPRLMQDRADPDVAKLRMMEKGVYRCQHKMKAFVRFRDLRSDGPRRSFAAWFEPTHFTVEPTAPFFARRFADMDWMIVTPDATAKFADGELTFLPGADKPALPEDATEDLWGTYFCNIFNPARVKVQAMTSEMPRKYWKNMPETQFIPGLLADAETKVRDMRDKGPTLPPERVAHIRAQLIAKPQPASWNMLHAGLDGCTRCPLHACASRVVQGEGPRDARLMIVGEQPGDVEDQTGRPFSGPAGQLFDQVASDVGLDRSTAYITNAVKHFKFTQRGKRRIHQNPNTSEIAHCKFWLESEIALIKPDLILAMGGTAALALTGTKTGIMKRRGTIEHSNHGPVFITIHPSAILRLPAADRPAAQAAFAADLAAARQALTTSV